ncbi:MAG: DUF4325 domain-containing protein [Burkholderiales bacterium]|nr:DUF4325 domain-containing protein [Burkholderiales bacterium]
MRPYIIHIPRNLGDKNLRYFFRKWTWLDNPNPWGWVELEFDRSEFISPWALTLFSIWALALNEIGRASVKFNIDTNTRPGKFLVQAGLLELIGDKTETGIVASDERTTRLTRIRNSQEISPFSKQVMQLLKIEDEELEGALEYALIELLRNVVQHSLSKVGGLCMAQYYPNTGLVELVVADIGIGVNAALRPRYREIAGDLHALKFSLLPHVSGTFGQSAYGAMKDNAGLGLFFVKEIATRSGGGFFLGSGKGLIDLWGNLDGTPGKDYISAEAGGWPGTFAVLQLRRDRIGDFASLLGRCRELAALARKDPSDLSLDFLDTIPAINGLEVIQVAKYQENVEEAARIRESIIIPLITAGQLVVMDFGGIRFATQSFVHACMYRVLKDFPTACHLLSLARCSEPTRQAIRVVAAYAVTNVPT